MKMEPARRLSSDGNSNNSQMTVLWNAVDSLTATRITERKVTEFFVVVRIYLHCC